MLTQKKTQVGRSNFAETPALVLLTVFRSSCTTFSSACFCSSSLHRACSLCINATPRSAAKLTTCKLLTVELMNGSFKIVSMFSVVTLSLAIVSRDLSVLSVTNAERHVGKATFFSSLLCSSLLQCDRIVYANHEKL